jgi:hypothetical protein
MTMSQDPVTSFAMNTAPETKTATAEDQGVSPITLIDEIHARITAVGAVASLLEFVGDIREANNRNAVLAPKLEEIPEPSADVIGGAVRAIDFLLEGLREGADQLCELARCARQAEPSK